MLSQLYEKKNINIYFFRDNLNYSQLISKIDSDGRHL